MADMKRCPVWITRLLLVISVTCMASASSTGDSAAAHNVYSASRNAGLLLQDNDGNLLVAGSARVSHATSSAEKLATFLVGLGYGDGDSTYHSAALRLLRFTPQGLPDTRFGGGGSVLTPLLPLKNRDSATMTTLLKDSVGRLIVVGWQYLWTASDSNVRVITAARYTAVGELDTSFAEQGILTTRVAEAAVTQAFAAMLDNEDRLLVAGYNGGKKSHGHMGSFTDWSVRAILLRYTASGVLDTSFGTGGIVSQDIRAGGSSRTKGRDFLSYDYRGIKTAGLTLDRMGRPVLAAMSDEGLLSLTRYTPNGVMDVGFGSEGVAQTTLGKDSSISSLLWDFRGRLIAVGTSDDSSVLLRYSADGLLDSTFGTSGISRTSIRKEMRVSASLLDGNGRLLVVASGEHSVWLARYDREGLLDKRFGSDGVVETTSKRWLATRAGLTIGKDGIPVVAVPSDDGIFIMRFQTTASTQAGH